MWVRSHRATESPQWSDALVSPMIDLANRSQPQSFPVVRFPSLARKSNRGWVFCGFGRFPRATIRTVHNPHETRVRSPNTETTTTTTPRPDGGEVGRHRLTSKRQRAGRGAGQAPLPAPGRGRMGGAAWVGQTAGTDACADGQGQPREEGPEAESRAAKPARPQGEEPPTGKGQP